MPAFRGGFSIIKSPLPTGGSIYFATDPADTVVGAEIREYGWWRGPDTHLVCALVEAGDHAVDAGAHIGYFTAIMARRAGPAGRVVAFEPEPRNFELLKTTCILNGAINVELRRQALGEREAEASLYLGSGNLGDHRLHATSGRTSIRVDVVRLDDCFGGRPVDFLKLDVQGSEPAVLAGARMTIGANAARLVCLMELSPRLSDVAGYGRDAVLDLLADLQALAFTATVPPRRLTGQDVAELWDRLHAKGDDDANDMLLLAFSPQAAARITGRCWSVQATP
jgi:FkbM family methyltransferase